MASSGRPLAGHPVLTTFSVHGLLSPGSNGARLNRFLTEARNTKHVNIGLHQSGDQLCPSHTPRGVSGLVR